MTFQFTPLAFEVYNSILSMYLELRLSTYTDDLAANRKGLGEHRFRIDVRLLRKAINCGKDDRSC
jgi:hypothetical protein